MLASLRLQVESFLIASAVSESRPAQEVEGSALT
jgi:hypothetical protein